MTRRERLFCEHYARAPSGTGAAIAAGYSEKTARQIASRLLTKVYIRQFISELTEELDSELIADARELRQTWTAIMRSKKASDRDRLKASELLAKSAGMFLARYEIESNKNDVVIYLPELEGEDEEEENNL